MSLTSMVSSDTAILITLVALAVSLAKIIEVLVRRLVPNNRPTLSTDELDKIKCIENRLKTVHNKLDDKPTLTDEQNGMLKDIHDLHSKTDADGIPLHYVPRSFIEAQKEIVDVLQEISSHQERTTYLLESITKRIEKLEDKIESCHYRKKE